MRKLLSSRRVFVTCVCLLSMATLSGIKPNSQGATRHQSAIFDWSMRHVIYPQSGPMDKMIVAARDPRAFMMWQRRLRRRSSSRHRSVATTAVRRDWSIYLGPNGTAPAMFPAEFSYNADGTPSCPNDFVVYPINTAGGAAQPNIVAFNYLYSGSAPAGVCNRVASGGDTGVSAEVYWSYNVEGITGGGAVSTSPTFSFDQNGTGTGTKIAFVESGNGAAHFHVLAWKTGDGKNLSNFQSVFSPVTINTFAGGTPVIGSGTATDLAFGTATDTRSSPFIDFQHDTAYVGNDAGQLYRIKDVFCMGINGGNPDCTNENAGPGPSIDTTWGAGGYVQVCAGILSDAAYDYGTGNVFVGCSDGKLYSISPTGTIASLPVGDGTTYGGIVDGPVVDYSNGFVYAVSGSGAASSGANGVMVQATTADLTSNVMVPVGTGGQCNIHEPIPNNAYLTSDTAPGAAVYVAGVVGRIPQPCTFTSNGGTGLGAPGIELYTVGTTASGTLTAGTPPGAPEGSGPGYEWAPLTEFYNANTGIDWLFIGTLQGAGSGQNNVASVTVNQNPNFVGGVIQEGMGVTGMVIDNDSAEPQAASFYFGAMGENSTCDNTTVTTDTGGCAVKLTQATLQ